MELDRARYLGIKRQLDFRPRLDVLVAWLGLDVTMALTACWLLSREGVLGPALAQPLWAMVAFNAFSILHECGHGSASGSQGLNTLLGHVASPLCGIPYYPWKYIHQKHHAWTGNVDRDPVLRSLRTWRDDGVPPLVRFAWRSWIPLGALMQHVVYWTYPLQMARDGEMTRTKLLRCTLSIAWIGGVYATALVIAPRLVLSIAPAVVLFLIAEELVNIPHHADVSVFQSRLPIWHQYKAARSCVYPRGLSELLVLNFNFHVEHHLFPALPWYRLRRARVLVKEALAESYNEAIGLSWNLQRRTRPLEEIVAPYRADVGHPT